MNSAFSKSIFVKFLLLIFILFLCACSSGGGGGGDDAIGGAESVPDFQPAEIKSQTTKTISPAAGGTIEHNGAALVIPPGALSEPATLTLAATNLPSSSLPEDDGALLGKTVLGSEGFVISADKDVRLLKAITLRLPIDASLVPENAVQSDFEVSTDVSGYLIPQGTPDRVSLNEGHIEWELWPSMMTAQGSNQVLGQPQPIGVPFLLLVAGLTAGTTLVYNPLVATLDQVNIFRFEIIKRNNFVIHYNPTWMDYGNAYDIGADLENAYYFYRDLGFSLPNLINLDGRFTVVIDNLTEHSLLPKDGNGNAPEGLALPGSSLFEGAIYINAMNAIQTQKDAAVHEYFHALQFGALDSQFIANMANAALNAQSQWLFEGSTTVMTGRLQYGGGITPTRDPDLEKRLRAGISLYDPNQDPAEDVAQDFFFYLERQLGHVDFYLPTFQALRPEPLDLRERAVRALDEVLQDMTGGTLDMETAYRDFIVDYWIDNIRLYPTLDNPEMSHVDETVVLNSEGDTDSASIKLPSLSYFLVRFYVPALEKDDKGEIIADQLKDVEIETSLSTSSGTGVVDIEFVDELAPTAAFRHSTFASAGYDRTHTFEDFRKEDRRLIIAVISNSATSTSFSANLSFSAKLAGKPPEDDDDDGEAKIQVIGIQNIGEALISQPTDDQIKNADIQLSGDPTRPTISWNFSGAVTVSLTGGLASEGQNIFKYGIVGVQEESPTGEILIEKIASPVRYGDYSVPRTEPMDDFLVPSPDLKSGIAGGGYAIYVLTENAGASLAFHITDD